MEFIVTILPPSRVEFKKTAKNEIELYDIIMAALTLSWIISRIEKVE